MINYNMFKKRKHKGMSVKNAALIVGAGAGLGIGMAVAYKMKDTIKDNVLAMFNKEGCGCGCRCNEEDDEANGYKYYVENEDDYDNGYGNAYANTAYYRRDRVNKKVPKGINGTKRVF